MKERNQNNQYNTYSADGCRNISSLIYKYLDQAMITNNMMLCKHVINHEQMSNRVRVEHQPAVFVCICIFKYMCVHRRIVFMEIDNQVRYVYSI